VPLILHVQLGFTGYEIKTLLTMLKLKAKEREELMVVDDQVRIKWSRMIAETTAEASDYI